MNDGILRPGQVIQIIIDHLMLGRIDIARSILETLRDQLEASISQPVTNKPSGGTSWGGSALVSIVRSDGGIDEVSMK